MFSSLEQIKEYLGRAAKILIGIPGYDNYVEHMETNHPDKPYMSYEEFFRGRQNARYNSDGKDSMRCCQWREHEPDYSYPTHRFSRCG